MKRAIIIVLILANLAWPQPSVAASREFDPNFIIDDVEFSDNGDMSLASLQSFLNAKSSYLTNYQVADIDGVTRPAADIIWRSAQRHHLNPKVLVVLLQKEQSLIEDPTPSQNQLDWATGYAVCDSCDKTDPALQKFRGFGVQVDKAAARLRYYTNYPQEFAVQYGRPYLIDGLTVVPASQATANLYIYTPHLNGNRNFWLIWQRYFSRSYPDGSLIRDQLNDTVWLISYGQRREFQSKSTLYADYDVDHILDVPHADIEQIEIGLPIKFPIYSLLRSPGGTVYLLTEDSRRGIASAEDFRRFGFNPGEIINATWADLNTYPEGEPLRATNGSPIGDLYQNNKTGGVYFVINNVKQPIITKDLLIKRFSNWPIKAVAPAELDKWPTAGPVGWPDGSLVKSAQEPTVYVISNGLKRPIASADTFEGLGYKWTNIIQTSTTALSVNPTGEVISI
jgi:hypothetical protein